MTAPRRGLIALYAFVALAALIGTWSQNLFYFHDLSGAQTIAAFGKFVEDLRVNPATRSVSIDIMAFLFAAAVWMVFEARRVGVRYVWLYIGLAFVTAISVTFSLFLIAREYRLAARGEGSILTGTDLTGLAVLGGLTLWICAYLAT